MRTGYRSKWSFVAVAFAVALAACAPETDEPLDGDLDTGEPMAETETDDGYGETYGDPLTDETAASIELSVQQSDTHGEYITGNDGRPLYLFTADVRGESSACYDACAEAWPPVTGDVSSASGLDATLVGAISRDDGSIQATYNGWPLYEFARDSGMEPTGQDIESFGGEWYLISPAGEQVHAE